MLAILGDDRVREQGRAAAVWLAGPLGRWILAVALLAFAGLAAFTLYEALALGLPVAREEPARFDPYHLAGPPSCFSSPARRDELAGQVQLFFIALGFGRYALTATRHPARA